VPTRITALSKHPRGQGLPTLLFAHAATPSNQGLFDNPVSLSIFSSAASLLAPPGLFG
jgi:hypothetical protein